MWSCNVGLEGRACVCGYKDNGTFERNSKHLPVEEFDNFECGLVSNKKEGEFFLDFTSLSSSRWSWPQCTDPTDIYQRKPASLERQS